MFAEMILRDACSQELAEGIFFVRRAQRSLFCARDERPRRFQCGKR